MEQGTLSTRKGEFTFEYQLYYHSDLNADVYSFNIWDENEPNKLHKFNFLLRVMENGQDLMVADIYAHDYKKRGISIPIILKSKELFNKRIISSSNTHKSYLREANWPEAIEKVWKPMVDQGLARYDEEFDHYVVL